MSYIDSPFAACNKINEMVFTDCSQIECAKEHECPKEWHPNCPLLKVFEISNQEYTEKNKK